MLTSSRLTTRQVYNSKRWSTLRRHVLRRAEYQCRASEDGCTNFATEADHIVPLTQGGPPFDEANVQALCKHCHSRKTAREVAWNV